MLLLLLRVRLLFTTRVIHIHKMDFVKFANLQQQVELQDILFSISSASDLTLYISIEDRKHI